MEKANHSFWSVIVLLAASLPALAQEKSPSRPNLADYNSELRGLDGRVDTDAMVERLKDLGVTTYYWLVWHAATDWDDLKAFLPKAATPGRSVMSRRRAVAWPPVATMSKAAWRNRSSLRTATTTVALSAASTLVILFPMPLPPPASDSRPRGPTFAVVAFTSGRGVCGPGVSRSGRKSRLGYRWPRRLLSTVISTQHASSLNQ